MEAIWFKSGHHRGSLTGELPVVVCLSLGGRDIPDGLQQSVVVEPGYPFEVRQFQRFLGLAGRATIDQLSFVQPVDRLGQGVVIAVALAAHRRLDASLAQAFAVPNGLGFHGDRIYRCRAGPGLQAVHGRPWRMEGQRVCGTAVAQREVRAGIPQAYDSVSAARADIADYMGRFNSHRPHSSLERLTPDEKYLVTLPTMDRAA